jgi:hypothetical protein
MQTSARFTFALPILVIALAACAATPAATPSASPTPEVTPSPSAPESETPSETPAAEAPEADGTITVERGAIADGPGASITQALEAGLSEPNLVNGVLVLDTEGNLWFVDAIAETSPLTFEGAVLQVLNYPDSPDMWDPANAEVTGLQERDGVLYFEDMQIYGVVEAA